MKKGLIGLLPEVLSQLDAFDDSTPAKTRATTPSLSPVKRALNMAAVTSIKEPQTGTTFPSSKPSADGSKTDTLIGVGCRIKNIMFMNMKILSAGMYIDVEAAAPLLKPYVGKSLAALQADQSLFDVLIKGPFRKSMIITFAMGLTKAQLSDGYVEDLKPRLPSAKKHLCQIFTKKMTDVRTHDTITVNISPEGLVDSIFNGEPTNNPLTVLLVSFLPSYPPSVPLWHTLPKQ